MSKILNFEEFKQIKAERERQKEELHSMEQELYESLMAFAEILVGAWSEEDE